MHRSTNIGFLGDLSLRNREKSGLRRVMNKCKVNAANSIFSWVNNYTIFHFLHSQNEQNAPKLSANQSYQSKKRPGIKYF
jgi:hypothetical protein